MVTEVDDPFLDRIITLDASRERLWTRRPKSAVETFCRSGSPPPLTKNDRRGLRLSSGAIWTVVIGRPVVERAGRALRARSFRPRPSSRFQTPTRERLVMIRSRYASFRERSVTNHHGR